MFPLLELASVEWIVEDPQVSAGRWAPLADFGVHDFTSPGPNSANSDGTYNINHVGDPRDDLTESQVDDGTVTCLNKVCNQPTCYSSKIEIQTRGTRGKMVCSACVLSPTSFAACFPLYSANRCALRHRMLEPEQRGQPVIVGAAATVHLTAATFHLTAATVHLSREQALRSTLDSRTPAEIHVPQGEPDDSPTTAQRESPTKEPNDDMLPRYAGQEIRRSILHGCAEGIEPWLEKAGR